MLKLLRYFKINYILLTSLFLIIALRTVGTLYLPTLTADIINNGVIKGDVSYVIKTGGMMLFIAALTGILAIISVYLTANFSSIFSRNIRRKIFSQAQRLSVQDFKHFSTASLITRCTSDVNHIENAIALFFKMIIPVPFITVIGMFLAFSKDPYMALLILVTALIFLVFTMLISKKIIILSIRMQTELDRINSKVRQFISGIRVIRAFNRENHEKEKMDDTFTSYSDINIKINKIYALAMPFVMIVLDGCTVAVLWFGAIRINNGYLLIGDIMAVVEYAILILVYFVMAIMVLIDLPRAIACSKRILEVLEYQPEIIDKENTKVIPNMKNDLEFRNVTFSYQDAKEPILKSLNFACERGKTTAIIGATGSGKSTISKLIPRLHQIQGGEIILNGVNIKDFTQTDLRDKISYCPQKAFLFSGTIAENIRHGKRNATIEEIKNAAIAAQADAFIMGLSAHYDAQVSQGGSNFSGGQKQRLCIARALVKKSDIYIFDDSFSALDYKTDVLLRKAIKIEVKNAIVITIAQRISSILDADQIVVLEEGKIAGVGNHKELLKNCSVYQQIVESQLSKEELEC
nr:ABC transporter ATP-binding protein [uncultured Aminipila sp.]